jgi:hypothetical protein
MTPKDKAMELMLMYYDLIPMNTISFAKQCALIAVDELIEQENSYNNGSFYPSKYWKEVKQEIEKL